MKIAFINIYQNKVFRGAETFVYELSKRLSKNHKVDVLTSLNLKDIFDKKYDVVIPTNGRWQVILARLVTWLYGGKMIVSGQSGVGFDDRVNLYAFPDVFVALSTKAVNWAKAKNPLIKTVMIPNGVDLSKFKPEGNVYETNLKKPVVLCVGAFTEQKRIDLVINAVSKLKNASLLVAGGGGDKKQEIENLGKKMLGERFASVSVPFDKMPSVYRAANVFTLASASSESFGNVIVEAMASGLPVIVTDDPIRREIVGDAGVLIDPLDTESYSNELKKLIDSKLSAKAVQQAKKYNWDIIANQYEELLKTFKKEP